MTQFHGLTNATNLAHYYDENYIPGTVNVFVGTDALLVELLGKPLKRLRKGVPLLVANLGPATFNQDHNTLLLVDEAGHHPLPSGSKTALARRLVEELAQRLPA